MFVSANFLAVNYGVRDDIAKFFADREPPKENLYWKDKLMYLRPQPGYLFIPIIIDLLHKSGAEKYVLLEDAFLNVMETILHYSAEQEFEITDQQTAIEKSFQLVNGKATDSNFISDIKDYLQGKNNWLQQLSAPYPALRRGDLFLFVIATLNITEEQKTKIVKVWFALITTLLLLDDMEDISEDQKNGDENAFIESGLNQEGFDQLKQLLSKNLNELKQVNSVLANHLHRKFGKVKDLPIVSEFQIQLYGS
jgi:hypothetical protein